MPSAPPDYLTDDELADAIVDLQAEGVLLSGIYAAHELIDRLLVSWPHSLRERGKQLVVHVECSMPDIEREELTAALFSALESLGINPEHQLELIAG